MVFKSNIESYLNKGILGINKKDMINLMQWHKVIKCEVHHWSLNQKLVLKFLKNAAFDLIVPSNFA